MYRVLVVIIVLYCIVSVFYL